MRIKLILLSASICCLLESGLSQSSQQTISRNRNLSVENMVIDADFPIDSIKQLLSMGNMAPEDMGMNFYKLALYYTVMGNSDSAFYFIRQVLDCTPEFNHLIYTTNDFEVLRKNTYWKNLVQKIDSAHLSSNPDVEQPFLSVELYHIYLMDQYVRGLGLKNPELNRSKIDSTNIIEVVKIINQYGWPTFSMVGITAATGAFLVIQHSPIHIQQKYLPHLMEAVKVNEAKKEWLALLFDRISIRKKGVQIFGTQVFQVKDSITGKLGKYSYFPIMDESKVDSLRIAFDMIPLKEYYAIFGIDYKPTGK